MLPDYKSHSILRTRDKLALDRCEIIVDVGAMFDKNNKRFDHHQNDFNEKFNSTSKTKLSSAGLIYKYYGFEIINILAADVGRELIGNENEILFNKIYFGYIEHIDGIDNGISSHEGQANYSVASTLSDRISRMNVSWNEYSTETLINEAFLRAMRVAIDDFTHYFRYILKTWMPARNEVNRAIKDRYTFHKSGQIILLPYSLPFEDHLYILEPKDTRILFVISKRLEGTWGIKCVRESINTFNSRKRFPMRCSGLRDNDLAKAINIAGSIFVHAGGFVAANDTLEGALRMAEYALNYHD